MDAKHLLEGGNMNQERICGNENCGKPFIPLYENQVYCSRLCKRARVIRRNRGKKNASVYAARAADTKLCQHCNKVIQRGSKVPDYQWETQKYHKKCYKGLHTP